MTNDLSLATEHQTRGSQSLEPPLFSDDEFAISLFNFSHLILIKICLFATSSSAIFCSLWKIFFEYFLGLRDFISEATRQVSRRAILIQISNQKGGTENQGFCYWFVSFNSFAINLSSYVTDNSNTRILQIKFVLYDMEPR